MLEQLFVRGVNDDPVPFVSPTSRTSRFYITHYAANHVHKPVVETTFRVRLLFRSF